MQNVQKVETKIGKAVGINNTGFKIRIKGKLGMLSFKFPQHLFSCETKNT